MEISPVCDVRLDETEHLLSCFCDLNEHAVVDLQETKELKDFTGFGRNLVDTAPPSVCAPWKARYLADLPTNTDDKVNLRLRGDIEVAGRTRRSLEFDLVFLL